MINLPENFNLITSVINEEHSFLNDYIQLQERLNNQIHIVLRKLVDSQIISDLNQSKKLCDDLSDIIKILKKSNTNISSSQRILKKLDLIEVTSSDCKQKVEEYNDLYTKLFDNIVKSTTVIEKFLSDYNYLLNDTVSVTSDIASSDITQENTLIISEVDKKVVLPYTIDELNEILNNNSDKYATIKDIINTLYTKPLQYYSNSSFSRFKEAFKLIRERENGTIAQALDLAFELFSNYSLHPAVITACKNLDQLDVYLSCLEYNELDDFHFFKILFKVHPVSLNNKKKIKTTG